MGKATYIYWRHFTRYREEEDSLVKALKRAEYAEDSGNSSVESIITANGEVLDSDAINRYLKGHKELERKGTSRERARLMGLRTMTERTITWKEVSMVIRRMRWKPSVAQKEGIQFLVANIWGKEQRIASVAQLRTMTPAAFWQRLRKLEPYRVAEVERNIF